MSLSFAAAALKIGVPLSKFLAKHFLGELGGAASDGLIEMASAKLEDEAEQRIVKRAFEDMADKIISRLIPIFRDIPDSSSNSIAAQIGADLTATISADYILARNLDPARIATSIREDRKSTEQPFTYDESELYERALDEAIRYLVTAANSLPHFDVQSVKLTLDRLTRIGMDLEKALDSVSRIERQLSAVSDSAVAKQLRYEADYRQAVIHCLDFLELFGADISEEAQRHSLSVGYVSLDISEQNSTEKASSYRAEGIFSLLAEKSGRLIIRGHAGSGKSTLLRWVAISTAIDLKIGNSVERTPLLKAITRGSFKLETLRTVHLAMPSGVTDLATLIPRIRVIPALSAHAIKGTSARSLSDSVLRTLSISRVPFLVKLRDCKKGRLPPPDELPSFISTAIGHPPEEWVQNILLEGRALLLLDGVDEVPNARRLQTQEDIKAYVTQYPKCWFVVTTRPTAVPEGWLSSCGFSEATVSPMTNQDRIEFIHKWHEAVARELELQGRPSDLSDLADELISKLSESPAIARLATNPLLCAVICALHRDRNRKLPSDQSEICEAMCHLLIHRREVEANVPLSEFPEDYKVLSYAQKRGIVQEIAYFMARNEESSIEEKDAIESTRKILVTFPNAYAANPAIVLRSIIERSGVLREQRPGTVDFIHNTIKEFLSSEVFVRNGDVSLLAKHAADDVWKQIILFASATSDKTFSTKLVERVLEIADTSDEAKARLFRLTAVDCRSTALHMEASLVQRLSQVERQLVPPKTMSDAEALASSGDIVVPLLRYKRLPAREAAACVRTLRLIGTPFAQRILEGYLKDNRQNVVIELCQAVDPLRIQSVQNQVASGQFLADTVARRIRDLSPIAAWHDITQLDLTGVAAQDLSPLKSLGRLRYLDMPFSSVTSLAGLSGLPSLERVDASFTRVRDLGSLVDLPKLNNLILDDTLVTNFSAISQLQAMQFLSLDGTNISDLSFLGRLPEISRFFFSRCEQIDWSTLPDEIAVQHLYRSDSVLPMDQLKKFPDLRKLYVPDSELLNPDRCGPLDKLEEICLTCTRVSNLNWILKAHNLSEITLQSCDLSHYAHIFPHLTSAKTIALTLPSTSQITQLPYASNIKSIGFNSRDSDGLDDLLRFKDVMALTLPGFRSRDLEIVASLPKLVSLSVDQLDKSGADFLVNLPALKNIACTGPLTPEVQRIINRRINGAR